MRRRWSCLRCTPRASPPTSKGLFSIVIAMAMAAPDAPPDTLDDGRTTTQESRRSLFTALGELGVQPDSLADGALIVTVPVSGSARIRFDGRPRGAADQRAVAESGGLDGDRAGHDPKGATVGEVVELAMRPLRQREGGRSRDGGR